MADIDAFVQAEADALVRRAVRVVRHPLDLQRPRARAGDVRRSAEHLAGLMEAAGLDTEVLAADGGQPAVYGEWLGAGAEAPTVTVYGHHDVQPADPLEEWTTPPFEPTVRDGCLHARGASDDKGQIHFQVSAIRHLLAADGRLPVNVKFFVEGEEESGSPTIDAFLGRARRPAGLRPDPRLRHRDGRRGRAVAGHGHARARLLPGRPAHRPGRPALGLVRGRRPQRHRRAGDAAGRAQGRRPGASPSPAGTTTWST